MSFFIRLDNGLDLWCFEFSLRDMDRLSLDWFNDDWSGNLFEINDCHIFCLNILNNCNLLFWLFWLLWFDYYLIGIHKISFSFFHWLDVGCVDWCKLSLNSANNCFSLIIYFFEFFHISGSNYWLSLRWSSICCGSWWSCNYWTFINEFELLCSLVFEDNCTSNLIIFSLDESNLFIFTNYFNNSTNNLFIC